MDRVREFYDAWNDAGVDAMRERYWDPAIEGREDPVVPDAAVYRGHEGMVRWMSRLIDVFGEFKVRPEEVVEHEGRYLVKLRLEGRGSGSGVPVEEPIFHVVDLGGDGKVVRLQNFLDRERAVAALRAGAGARADADA